MENKALKYFIMSDKIKEEELKVAEKRLSKVETEIVMGGYLNGWLLKSYKEEAKILRERIKVLKEEFGND
jgi:hypothetical protein